MGRQLHGQTARTDYKGHSPRTWWFTITNVDMCCFQKHRHDAMVLYHTSNGDHRCFMITNTISVYIIASGFTQEICVSTSFCTSLSPGVIEINARAIELLRSLD